MVGERMQQVNEVAQLRMIEPGLEGHTQVLQTGKAGAERRISIQARRRPGRGGWRDPGVIGAAVANPFEAAAAGSYMRLQHGIDTITQQTVGMSDYAGTGPQASIF